jgi:hypothetical protein
METKAKHNSTKTKTTILNFVIDATLLDRIGVFWHRHRFTSRAAAVKWLLAAALDAGLKPEKEK